jgi:hypothetical protein
MRWGGHIACVGDLRNRYKMLIGMPEGENPLLRPGHR